jgi:hypothetical protein
MSRPMHSCHTLLCCLLGLLSSAVPLCLLQDRLSAAEIDFVRDVRPILSDKCYACHGPDGGQRQADLRFDTQEGAFRDLGGSFAIVAGEPEESELVRRITAGPGEQMPPAEHKKQLTEAEKKTLVEWVRQGAQWSGHWAYLAPQRDRPSQAAYEQSRGWAGNWIDVFIVEKLQQFNLLPSPQADARTLYRRLSFDLTVCRLRLRKFAVSQRILPIGLMKQSSIEC